MTENNNSMKVFLPSNYSCGSVYGSRQIISRITFSIMLLLLFYIPRDNFITINLTFNHATVTLRKTVSETMARPKLKQVYNDVIAARW